MEQHTLAGYAPGPWTGIIGARLALLAEFEPSGPVASACWEALERGAGPDALLGVIVREGLRNVPSFALLARTDAGTRVLVSGKARAHINGQHAELLSAAESPTWLERTVEATAEVRLLAGTVTAEEAPLLPVGSGIVLAGAIALAAQAAPGPVADAAPAGPGADVPRETSAETRAETGADLDVTGEQSPVPSFDHLFGSTVEPASLVDAGATVGAQQAQPAGPAPVPTDTMAPLPTDTMLPVPSDTMAPLPAEAVTPGSEAAPDPPAEAGVIESLPWQLPEAFRAVGSHPAAAAQPAPATTADPNPTPQPVSPSTAPQQPGAPAFAAPAAQAPPVPAPEPAAPMVAATACPNRHLCPPQAGTCRVCGAAVPAQEPFHVPRPVLGVLSLSTGDMVPLDRDVILGRAPSFADDDPHTRPHLVQLASPDNDISRNHVRVSLEGWHVLVIDLGSTNGTVVTLPGQQPIRLRPHDPFTIVAGTIVTIADEVSLRFDVHQ